MDWDKFTEMVERVGISTAVLFFVLVVGLRYIIKPLVKSHKDLIEGLKKSNEINTKNLTKLTEFIETHVKDQDKKEQAEQARFKAIEDNLSKLGEVLDAHLRHHQKMGV